MTSAVSSPSRPPAIRMGMAFDLFYVILLPVICIVVGYAVAQSSDLFELALLLNLWLLGYHHVIATYTRVAFDTKSVREHRYEVLVLPFLVVAAVTCMITVWGAWLVGTVYLHWQWYHYTRQSEGVAKSYLMKCENHQGVQSTWRWFRAAFYIVSVAPFLMAATRDTHKFLGHQVWMPPLDAGFMKWFAFAYVLAVIVMFVILIRWLVEKKTTMLHVAYLVGHALIYGYAYGVCENLDEGWLALSMWHNTQYLLFVWMFNRKRFKNGVDASHPLVSYLSQPGRAMMYFLITMLVTLVVYGLLHQIIVSFMAGFVFQATVVAYQTLNFHHYIVDSRIWKLRKADMKKTLGLVQS